MTAHAIQNIRARDEWTDIINNDWRRSVEGVVQAGRDLNEAQAQLSDRDFKEMIRDDLPFTRSTARKLQQIARHPKIGGGAGTCPLPASWAVLVRLAALSVEEFEDAQTRGLIDEKTSKRKANAIATAYKAAPGVAVGESKDIESLPSPKEAREVARATSRLVAASDGNLYSGATEEEGAEHTRRRDQSYFVIDAINAIVDCGVSPKQWCEELMPHWLNRFEFGRIEAAIDWLTGLKAEAASQNLSFDVEGKVDGK